MINITSDLFNSFGCNIQFDIKQEMEETVPYPLTKVTLENEIIMNCCKNLQHQTGS